MAEVSFVGGARVGWLSASWPFARLSAGPRRLELSCLGKYEFSPEQVTGIENQGIFLGGGVRIRHNRRDYPEKIAFFSFSGSDSLRIAIAESGFRPEGQAAPRTPGFAIRWSVVIGAVLVWNLLFLLDMGFPQSSGEPGWGAFTAVALLAGLSLALISSPALQRAVLRPGHDFGEIRSSIRLLAVVGAFLAIVLAAELVGRLF